MKYSFLIFFIVLLQGIACAQYKGVFLELGGSGGLGSVNYEKPLWISSRYSQNIDIYPERGPVNYFFNWRIGLGFSPVDHNNGSVLVFPVMADIIYGHGKHKLEAGAGIAPSITTKGAFFIKSPVMIGYRFQPDEKKLFFRISYTPLVAWLVDFQWQHWAGISIGYNIK